MKLSATLLLLALCTSDAARGGTRRRAQDEGDDVVAAPADDEIIADGGQNKAFGTSKKEGGVAIITNFYRDCYYQFKDKDDYVVLEDSESAMTCANNICNVDFLGNTPLEGLHSTTNRIVGLNLKPDPFRAENDQLIGEFRVGAGFSDSDLWYAAFTCPAGYYVQELFIKQQSNCGGNTGNACQTERVCNNRVHANSASKFDRQVCTEFVDPNGGITLGKVGSKTGQSVTYTLKCREL
mmetsp:Transcript_22941/g.54408  ORF Transcript_22941/g.54408 Transcript_22941/m.54408 type:complete len:238 (+) Transcript_22941:265-978(+)|eukprot:CAMPEP_0185824984 /NCGR_PEP_ID=MMETSP1322-20130828/30455_1 /TAXON_ID=265543 /ORGANISM="Minutocellus polymorphus, Strain RCC2270" /LENGTH=237 /DNA_ID=CAMNT_0028522675 /DNA_START=237 /DNA_END=950 /DNA_ORIENTATION=-